MEYLLIYLVIVNVVAAMATIYDKTAARNGEARISESALFVLAAIGGSIGMYITMRIIRHKTRKNKFMVGIPVIILLEIGLAAIIYFDFFGKF